MACDKMDSKKKFCVYCADCPHYKEEKMDFFEARNKAKFGDTLKWSGSGSWGEIIVGENKLLWADGTKINQYTLFEKEWTIIPKKKTVTLEIPEGAENVFITYWGNREAPHLFKKGGIKEITYLIEEQK